MIELNHYYWPELSARVLPRARPLMMMCDVANGAEYCAIVLVVIWGWYTAVCTVVAWAI